MKANQRIMREVGDRAEVGVGTLIVFIAMVLVAAVAAAVLINTTGTLQQRAQKTGQEATTEVASNLKVLNVYGVRNSTSVNVWDVDINLELSAGAVPIDFTKVLVRYSDGSNVQTYNFSSATLANGAAGQTWFVPTWIRGTGTNSIMQPGDLVQVHYNLNTFELGTRKQVTQTFVPESGAAVSADFKTPATYGTDTTSTLR